jgi:hypothetical protein
VSYYRSQFLLQVHANEESSSAPYVPTSLGRGNLNSSFPFRRIETCT